MLRQFLSLSFLIYSLLLTAQSMTYSQVRIDLTTTPMETLAALGLEVDHGIYAPGKHLINVFNQEELSRLSEANVSFEVLIPDARADYEQRVRTEIAGLTASPRNNDGCGNETLFNYPTPVNYEPGSMGGYLTYDELLETLDSMAAKYPNLITPKTQIDDHASNEGRPIYYLRLSDNPQLEEGEEPELLYTALHHAREPNSLAQMIFFIWYLLENYGEDPEVTYLVDNTELYFIPCVNPDGYVYNELTNPFGGGFWRKNRRLNDDGTFGVDLNRNYGFEWGYDDFGSSPNPGSEVYRGTEAFSEPETQAVRDLCIDHNFRITLNYHTFGNLLIYPWGYEDGPTPDQPTFRAFSDAMTKENGYFAGTGLETVGYTVNGDSDDWMYGDSISKPKIYSYTPEVGPQFWPTPGEIDQLNKACLEQNLTAAHLLHNYGEVEEQNGEVAVSTLEGNLDLLLTKYGLVSGPLTVTVAAAENNLTILGNNTISSNLDHLEEFPFTVDFLVDDQTPAEAALNFIISIDNGLVTLSDTITKIYQPISDNSTILVSDDGSDLDNWTAVNGWGITEEAFVSAPSSFTDSPETDYSANTDNYIRFNNTLDLTLATAAYATFAARWDIEANYDYAQFMVSTDGVGWQSLCGLYTTTGSEYQEPDIPLYDGTQTNWVNERIDLNDYLGQVIRVQFRFVSDAFIEEDGFYFDDFKITVEEPVPSSSPTSERAILTSEVAPQPLRSKGILRLNLPKATGDLRLELLTSYGQSVKSWQYDRLAAGPHQLGLDLSGLPVGVYLLGVKLEGQLANTHRILKLE